MEIFLPNRMGNILSEWLGSRFEAERPRWVLWVPVALGLGIGLYFAFPFEPWVGAGPLAAAACALAALGLRRWLAVMMLAVGVALVAVGFSAAAIRTHLVAAPVLERPTGKIPVSGTVLEVEPQASGGARVVLDGVRIDGLDGPVPERVRLRMRSDVAVPVGAWVTVAANLIPPPQPVMPGAFDFARHAWFMGLGGVGTAYGEPQVQGGDGVSLNGTRLAIAKRVMATLPDERGGVAQALMTGDTGAIPKSVLDAYRDSGLAHLLAISGLHMGLLAGLVFFVVRGGLALVPAVALRHPIKKWAAGMAMAVTFAYVLLAGMPVPATRSFLMTAIVLVAVMLDRSALSMRLVAWAAVALLLLRPESLVGPSFQMSFAAVAALIAAYETVSPRLSLWRAGQRGWPHRLGLYVAGVLFSSLIAGTATAVYGGFHFNRLAVWSLAANLAAVPLTGLVVMPSGLLSVLLMPFGLEGLALAPMGWGVAAVNWVAATVAAWPQASVRLPVLPVGGLALFTLGGLWLVLWQRRWRLWGVPAMLAGLSCALLVTPPDLLVDGRGQGMAIRAADGALLAVRGGRLVRETWDRRAGPLSAERWPKTGRSADGRLSCDRQGCLYRMPAHLAVLVLDDDGVGAACGGTADLVLAAVPVRQACRGAGQVVDRFDLWRRGGHAFWFGPGGVRMESVAAWQGDRPWSYRPHRRRKKAAPQASEAADTESDDD
jgi:competence protein ComEC